MPQLRRILHVDDDAEIRLIAEISLKLDPELSVAGAGSAEEALEILRATAAFSPTVLLLDYFVGDMNGVQLLQHVQQDASLPDMPTVFLTARVLQRQVEEMLDAGALGVLSKPFNPITLASELRTLLGG